MALDGFTLAKLVSAESCRREIPRVKENGPRAPSSAAKLKPKKYGDRLDLSSEVTHKHLTLDELEQRMKEAEAWANEKRTA